MKLKDCKYKIGDRVWFLDKMAMRVGIVCSTTCSNYSDETMEDTNGINLSIRTLKREQGENNNTSSPFDNNRKQFDRIDIDHDEVFDSKEELLSYLTLRSDK